MVRVQGKISEADYVRAQWLHLRTRKTYLAFGVLLAAVLLMFAVVKTVGWVRGDNPPESIVAPLFLSLAYLSYFFIFLPYWFRRSYRNYPAIREPVDLTFNEEGLNFISENAQGKIPWKHFHKWRAGRSLFLIYQSPGLFHIVPKQLLSPSEGEQELRGFLEKTVGLNDRVHR